MSDEVDLESIPIPKLDTDSIPLPTADSIPMPSQLPPVDPSSADKAHKKLIKARYNLDAAKPKPPDSQANSNTQTKSKGRWDKLPGEKGTTVVKSNISISAKTSKLITKGEQQMSQTIVDDFFKDFIATKMKQIEQEYKDNDREEVVADQVITSVEEMNRLLDEEINQIGKNTNYQLTTPAQNESELTEKDNAGATESKSGDVTLNKTVVTYVSDDKVTGFSNSAGNVFQCGTKKAGPLKIKLGIKISDNSAALISAGIATDETPQKKALEEGEVLSSGENSDSDEAEEKEGEVSDDDDDDDNVSETGSLSDSDKDTKSVKSKKKKKKKHKHKKKKKHKASKEKDKDKDEKPSEKSKRKHTHKSRSRSRSPKKSRHSRSSSGEKKKSKKPSRSGSKERYFTKPLEVKHDAGSRSKDSGKGRDHDRGSRKRSRSRSRSRERDKTSEDLRLKIDKSKLRQIAIKNALANAMTGQGPQVDVVTMKSGGKSVAELTDFCKRISSRQKHTATGDTSSSDEESQQPMQTEDDEGPFIHHPFKLREANPNIVMNIRDAKQLPVLTPQEKICQVATLRLQFPVSSGSTHRQSEPEWVPVDKNKFPAAATNEIITKATTTAPVADTPAASTAATHTDTEKTEHKVFPDPPKQPIDIGSIISERLQAVRKLAENPTDLGAVTAMQKAQKQASLWAASKQLPGQFLGSTGAQVMSQQELMGPNKRHQAWLKKDQFTRAAPLRGGIGMMLLQKMGWKQGEGLGRMGEGSKEPLLLDVKTDRRGLTSQGESSKRIPHAPMARDLSGKHPVSALVELCNKRKWGAPDFQVVSENGPDHKKNFLFKVIVDGNEYQPSAASNNKKTAKAMASTICLQQLGLVPRVP